MIHQATPEQARRCYSFDRRVYDRADQARRAIGIGGPSIGLDAADVVGGAAPFTGDFKSLVPGWDFLIDGHHGVSTTGSVVDSWTDQVSGLVGTAPTGTQKPITVTGPNGRTAVKSVSGQNTSVAFAYAMPAPITRMTFAYAVFRQDAWTANSALFGSPGAEFSLRVLQFNSSPRVALAQNVPVDGTAVGSYGVLIIHFYGQAPGDSIKYGSAAAASGLVNNVGNSALTVFNQLNALPSEATLCLLGFRTTPMTAPQIATMNAGVTTYYGAGVDL